MNPKRIQKPMSHSTIQMTFDIYGRLFANAEADRKTAKDRRGCSAYRAPGMIHERRVAPVLRTLSGINRESLKLKAFGKYRPQHENQRKNKSDTKLNY